MPPPPPHTAPKIVSLPLATLFSFCFHLPRFWSRQVLRDDGHEQVMASPCLSGAVCIACLLTGTCISPGTTRYMLYITGCSLLSLWM